MIAIFNTLAKANNYANALHAWLQANRSNYNATKWATPVVNAEGNLWTVKKPAENPQLPELLQATTTTIPLPEVGVQCVINTFYLWKGDIVKCRQTHNRTIYDPKDTPALFSFYRDNTADLQWIVGEQVQVGWMRIYNNIKYEVIQAHQTQSDWTPPATPTLWKIYVDPTQTTAWAYPVGYVVNQLVTYNGHTYKCLQAHTSQAGWTPSAVPALWQMIS